MKHGTLLAAVVVSLSGFSSVVMAANPFLVSQASIEANEPNGGRAGYRLDKSVTLAESLVQLRQCRFSNGHQVNDILDLTPNDQYSPQLTNQEHNGFNMIEPDGSSELVQGEVVQGSSEQMPASAEEFDFDLSEVQIIK